MAIGCFGTKIVKLYEEATDDLGVIRLERWDPDGFVIWCGGEIRWKSWEQSMGAPRLMKPENVAKAAELLADVASLDAATPNAFMSTEGALSPRLNEMLSQQLHATMEAVRKKLVAELHALGVKVE